ncbi:DUF948 domain-containing protein [Cyanobacteria bacterium FACHB-DQ100]|uniref:DUF948 domain-containing protein n=1 Tax=Leptolyngbya sp. DQ-M1 TaxID=2933920 RepID=UPI001999C87F|nr:DUF948 domain-containing protein [Cyanobacteria bacterium FACHB-DQ100]
MADPIFWLGLSILLVAISLTALLTVAIPAFNEMGRAARSAEKLFDTLNRELPPTLEALRITGLEVTDLTDDVTQGVQSATQVVKQVDQSITGVKQQVQKAQTTSRSVFVGVKAAWRTLTQPNKSRRSSRLASGSDPRSFFRPTAYRDPFDDNHYEDSLSADPHHDRHSENLPNEQSDVQPTEPPRQPVQRKPE